MFQKNGSSKKKKKIVPFSKPLTKTVRDKREATSPTAKVMPRLGENQDVLGIEESCAEMNPSMKQSNPVKKINRVG